MIASPETVPEAPSGASAVAATGGRDSALHALAGGTRLCFIFHHFHHQLKRTGRLNGQWEQPDPRWDGVPDRRGRRRRAIWYDVAERVLAERITPDELVDAAFFLHDAGMLPQPISLLTPAVLGRAVD